MLRDNLSINMHRILVGILQGCLNQRITYSDTLNMEEVRSSETSEHLTTFKPKQDHQLFNKGPENEI
jgi:hypothetical protein